MRVVSAHGLRGRWLHAVWIDRARRSLVLFWRDNLMGMAGMIAFFGFLSVVPLLILLLALLGTIYGGSATDNDVRSLLHGVMPGLSTHQFNSYWRPVRQSRATTTILGIASLFFGSLGLHDSIDWSVNRVWHAPRGHPFWIAKLRGVAIILWVALYAIFSLGLASAAALLLAITHTPPSLAAIVSTLLPALIIDFLVFVSLYKFTPTVDVDLRSAVIGGAVAAVLWAISKIIFGWWVLQVGTYNRVYGPLAATVIVMLWLWISAMIFLYGAALSAILQRGEP